jgi:hypothetical protein
MNLNWRCRMSRSSVDLVGLKSWPRTHDWRRAVVRGVFGRLGDVTKVRGRDQNCPLLGRVFRARRVAMVDNQVRRLWCRLGPKHHQQPQCNQKEVSQIQQEHHWHP